MNLTVNGKPATINDKETLTVAGLLLELTVQQPDYVTVELNGAILERDDYVTTTVKNGDAVEFLYFMGGGSR